MSKVKYLLVLCSLLWLAGCTPEYNWRELTVADDRAVVMFPSRVQTEQRKLRVEGIDLVFFANFCRRRAVCIFGGLSGPQPDACRDAN